MWLFFAFLSVPLIEIALFIQIGGLIGLWPTLGIVVLTAVIGTWLVRSQGKLALANLRRSFSDLDDPTEPLAHGAMILFSGALLLTPGFFTDAAGFALLMPPVRDAVFRWMSRRIKVHRFSMGEQPPRQSSPHDRPDVIDGEFTEMPQGKAPNHPGSGWTRH
ncbi:FxsA family protein [Thalassococcus sp. CAU 1522]|uniref:FxsA family protein n=1 Tax=Thalassococcus arenae TaxID=2851652 RepID=A0ABS6N5V8_9RHOB|nr:FxsA family protein [Thalassococcus arenae]MBV2359404.1 FxsA family protein [Thalassococcus arenae]